MDISGEDANIGFGMSGESHSWNVNKKIKMIRSVKEVTVSAINKSLMLSIPIQVAKSKCSKQSQLRT